VGKATGFQDKAIWSLDLWNKRDPGACCEFTGFERHVGGSFNAMAWKQWWFAWQFVVAFDSWLGVWMLFVVIHCKIDM
jgi:hypothetical protein